MHIDDFLRRLKGVTKSGSGWMACCPAHDDQHPSLSIATESDGKLLLKCMAGCSTDRVVTAMGLRLADLFPERARAKGKATNSRIVATYDYHDESGALLFQVCRFEPKDFRQRAPDGKGNWARSTKGVRKVLFRLPETIAAVAAGKRIVVAEGEKDVLALVGHGFDATCNPGGAGKWLDEHTQTLRGAAVVIIADKDAPGRAAADKVGGKLCGVAVSVKVIECPDVGGRAVKDAADYFAAGGTAEALGALMDATPEFSVKAEPVAASPAQWFTDKFPALATAELGGAIREEADKDGNLVVKDIGEDFLAATMGAKGSPDAPTVFVPTEEKFYTYEPGEGVFGPQRADLLLTRWSRLLLDCHHACKEGCDTMALEYRFRDAASLSGVLRKARGLLEVAHDFFASDLTEFIPCANGMLRLRDRTLLPFSPSYRRRNKLAAPYNPGAKCPIFLDALMRAALDDDDLELLQRYCGMVLLGENLAQRIMLLTGTAGGGKGTFVRVLTAIIGQRNLASLRPQLLGERFELGRFLGKTLLYGPDVPDNFLNHRGAAILKSLTGYDPVTIEFKNSNESPSIICRFNVLATCNSRLTVHLEGDVDAWRRRLVSIEYRKPKPEKVVANLDKLILEQEAAGVLNWMLDGLDKFRADGWQLHLNARQQAVVDNLLLESDSLAVFAREGLRRDPGGQLTAADGFAAYVEFCTEHGWAAVPKNKFTSGIADVVVRLFGMTMRHDIPDARGKLQRGWKGLVISSAPTGKNLSEVSATTPAQLAPDSSDAFAPVHPAKITHAVEAPLFTL